MKSRRDQQVEGFGVSFLDLICCSLVSLLIIQMCLPNPQPKGKPVADFWLTAALDSTVPEATSIYGVVYNPAVDYVGSDSNGRRGIQWNSSGDGRKVSLRVNSGVIGDFKIYIGIQSAQLPLTQALIHIEHNPAYILTPRSDSITLTPENHYVSVLEAARE